MAHPKRKLGQGFPFIIITRDRNHSCARLAHLAPLCTPFAYVPASTLVHYI